MSRSFEKEILDLGPEHYTEKEYEDCLKKLNQVGIFLGGDRSSWKALKGHKAKSILDVGCGGGYFTYKLACKYPDSEVVGIDLSGEAIDFAKQNHKRENLKFLKRHSEDLSDLHADIVIATLVTHHMNDEELIIFLKQASKIAGKLVVINDLHRHFAASCFYAVIAPILFRQRLITHDGLLSIKRSFKKRDWISYLKKANIPQNQWTLKWRFPFRWVLKIQTG